jgi:hypothetical protein
LPRLVERVPFSSPPIPVSSGGELGPVHPDLGEDQAGLGGPDPGDLIEFSTAGGEPVVRPLR